jgi:Acyl-CoA dehydrogenase, N-terminal domain
MPVWIQSGRVTHEPALVAASVLATVAAAARDHDREASFPHDSIAALYRAGLLGLIVPSRLGGGGAGLGRAADAVAAVGGACASTALIFAIQLLHHRRLAKGGDFSPAVRDHVSRAAVEGGALINALRVEPALGTPARGGLPETIASRVPDRWRITGRKTIAVEGDLDALLRQRKRGRCAGLTGSYNRNRGHFILCALTSGSDGWYGDFRCELPLVAVRAYGLHAVIRRRQARWVECPSSVNPHIERMMRSVNHDGCYL